MKAHATHTERAKPRQGGAIASVPREGEPDSQIVAALSRGLALLDCFRRDDLGLGNAELAERTGLMPSTVSRLTYTLALHHYLAFDQRAREYRLGLRAMQLGAVALATTNVRSLCAPLMRQLARGSHFNVGLGTRDDLQMLYTDAAEGDALIALRLFPGSRLPLATSAMGRAYLAVCAPDERDELLQHLQTRYGDEWGRVLKGVEDAQVEYSRDGFCSSIGEWQKDINGVAVAIAPQPGGVPYVLNLGGPAYALPEDELKTKLAPQLIAISREAESVLFAE